MSIAPEEIKLKRARERRFAVVIWLAFIILFGRLWYLQIALGDRLLDQSETNRIRLLRVRAPRGVILDRKNRTVATSRPHFVVSVLADNIIPPDDATIEERRTAHQTLIRLCDILKVSQEQLLAIITKNQSIKGAPVRVAVNATIEMVAQIKEQQTFLPGVDVELDQIRYYPDGPLFAHALGYLREIDKDELERHRDVYRPGDFIGKSGIEKQYDRRLHGTDGGSRVEVNAYGMRTRVLGDQPSVPGSTLVLGLDQRVQAAAAKALEGKVGAAVAIAPKTGEILAMVSKPDFDPNVFASGLKSSDWVKITTNRNHPLQNRCISNKFPPGSTFKMVTAAAGLEYGVITTDSGAFCPGAAYLGRKRFGCWDTHRGVNFYTAISKSCDVFFYKTGRALGMERLTDMAFSFGMGNQTGIDLPNERSGNIPTLEWKSKVKGERKWHTYECFNSAIGQGDIEATPLQMAVVTAGVANDGKIMQPHVLREIRDPTGEVLAKIQPKLLKQVPVTVQNLESVKKGMRETTVAGTGRVVDLPGITVCSKTGSAQSGKGYKTHAWFVCFAPMDDPQIAICVFRERAGHGGSNSGPVARAMLEAYFGIEPTGPATVGRTD